MLSSSLAEMDDSSINKELKQKLNVSYCEEESESEGQKEAPESRETQSQTPDWAEGQESEAKFTPPRTPSSSIHGVGTFEEKDKMSPDQALRTPGPGFHKCPGTPAQPDSRSEVVHCESPYTPKVSKSWGKGTQVAKIWVLVQLMEKQDTVVYVYLTHLPHGLCMSLIMYLLVKMKKSFKLSESRTTCLASCLLKIVDVSNCLV